MTKINSTPTAFMLVTVEQRPVMLVPARSIEEAQQRAMDVLRKSPGDAHAVASSGAEVTLFSPCAVAGGEVLGYMPIGHGEYRAIASAMKPTGKTN